jgi:hypothetical protein
MPSTPPPPPGSPRPQLRAGLNPTGLRPRRHACVGRHDQSGDHRGSGAVSPGLVHLAGPDARLLGRLGRVPDGHAPYRFPRLFRGHPANLRRALCSVHRSQYHSSPLPQLLGWQPRLLARLGRALSAVLVTAVEPSARVWYAVVTAFLPDRLRYRSPRPEVWFLYGHRDSPVRRRCLHCPDVEWADPVGTGS